MTTRGSFLAGLGLFAGTTVLMIAGGAWAAEPQPGDLVFSHQQGQC